jgi:YgiT-type zinc finger domain-containing protein
MEREPLGASWERLIDQVLTGMRDWRTAHPTATFAEIEAAVDERLNRVRARLLEDAVLTSRSADLTTATGERPTCPHCGGRMVVRGQHERTLTVRGGQAVWLQRSYTTCPACGTGLFPLG